MHLAGRHGRCALPPAWPWRLVLRTANAAPVWRGGRSRTPSATVGGETTIFTDHTVLKTGYRFPPSCTSGVSWLAEHGMGLRSSPHAKAHWLSPCTPLRMVMI